MPKRRIIKEKTIKTPFQTINSLCHLAKGKKVLATGLGNSVGIWKTKDWSLESNIKLPAKTSYRCILAPNEKLVAVVYDHAVELRAVKTGALNKKLPFKVKGVNAAAFSEDSQFLAVGASDKKIHIWNLEDLS